MTRLRGATIGFGIALWGTTLIQEVPESKLSRTLSLDHVGSTGPTPVGNAPTAVLAPLRPLLVGGFALLPWVLPLASRRVRTA